MTKSILALSCILIFYTLQVFTQDCISPGGPFPNEKRVVVKVINSVFVPDCLTIYDGQSVVWEWDEVGDHTVTSNAGPFGSCNYEPSPVLEIDMDGLSVGDKVRAGPFKYDPDDPSKNELYYNCVYHCGNGMYGSIKIVKKNRRNRKKKN